MKYYHSYMTQQNISQETHHKLLELEAPKRPPSGTWTKYGALAACAVLIAGVAVWRMSPSFVPAPVQSGSQTVLDNTSLPAAPPLPPELSVLGDWETGFVVPDSGTKGKLALPMLPGILYPDRIDSPDMALSRAYALGSFTVDLTKEDIQTILWGPGGKPPADHPKTEQSDLPWMLFWDGYFVHGRAWYDGQGQLTELTIYGEKGRASFELELRQGALPFTCCVNLNRGDEISEFNGVDITGWSEVYDRDGDGETDYICGSEFMTKDGIGVRFVNQNSLMQAEYGEGEHLDLGGSKTFNALFVRQALTGGLYLDHLKEAGYVPAWREEKFSTLVQARQEEDFAPYLPTAEPEGYGSYTGNKEFYGRLSCQEGTRNMLFVRWSREYDNVEVAVYRDGTYSYNLVSPDEPETYDLSLYPIPWCDSVPERYRETVDDPTFLAADMSLAVVEARGREHDTGSMTYSFDVLHPDGTVVSYRCDGMTAQQVWALVAETL